MTTSAKYPVTPAVRVLREAGVAFAPHVYEYVEKGGTAHSASVLGVSEHAVVKTLVLETETKAPLLVLMHGDRELATGTLARHIGVKSVRLCDAQTAQKWTGYQFGGTSPFGTKAPNLPVYLERTVLDLPEVFVNGGKRGFLVSLAPSVFVDVLGALPIEATAPVASG